MSDQTPKQVARQRERSRGDGRYAKFPPCDGCGKAMGSEYASHPMTDCVGDDGENWHDTALTLCDQCSAATGELRHVSDFVAYRGGHRHAPPCRIKATRSESLASVLAALDDLLAALDRNGLGNRTGPISDAAKAARIASAKAKGGRP